MIFLVQSLVYWVSFLCLLLELEISKYLFQSEEQYEKSKSSSVIEDSYKVSKEPKPVNSVKHVKQKYNVFRNSLFLLFC